MTETLNFGDEVFELKLGKSFEPNGLLAFHSIKYDFKPQSLDTTKQASVQVGQNNSVTVTIPHVADSSSTHTQYQGNQKPSQRECVLILDHATGQFTLERLTSTLQLKSTRSKPSNSKNVNKQSAAAQQAAANKQLTTAAAKAKAPHAKKMKGVNGLAAAAASNHSTTSRGLAQSKPKSLSDESSDSDNSDTEQANKLTEAVHNEQVAPSAAPDTHSILSDDLQLSESDSSDSDSDDSD